MLEPKNVKALETVSGVTWKEWAKFLAPHQSLDHAALAKLVHTEIMRTGKSKSPEWWAQGVTVAYEQFIGRRAPGQTGDGNFSITVSRTVQSSMDAALANWAEACEPLADFNGVKITSKKDRPRRKNGATGAATWLTAAK